MHPQDFQTILTPEAPKANQVDLGLRQWQGQSGGAVRVARGGW